MKKFFWTAPAAMCCVSLGLGAQTNLTVDIDDPVYPLIEMAEVKGLIHRVSRVRPFPVTQIRDYLDQMYARRSSLSSSEKDVLEAQRVRFGLTDRPGRPMWASGRVSIGGEEGMSMENLPMTFRGSVDNLTNAEFMARAVQNLSIFKMHIEGDITPSFSYAFNVGFGASLMNNDAFAPFSHTTYNDGFALALSGGPRNSRNYKGFAVTFHFNPELQAQFLDNRIRVGFGRHGRSMGLGTGGLMVSDTARAYDAAELSFRPAEWFHYYYSVASLGNWFSQSAWMDRERERHGAKQEDLNNKTIDEKNFTQQTIEVMPWDWMYVGLSTGAIWGKRMELSYFSPLMPLLFAQNLYGDNDNMAMELSGAFNLPFGMKLYGTVFSDENQLNNITTLFTSTSQQFAIQAGAKALIPGLGFTLATFQYTKFEPFVYTHYQQVYPWSGAIINTNWTNDRYNLGYYLPPNSDEFQIGIESLPMAGFKVYASYRYIRHGYGNGSENGQIPGTVDSGGTFSGTDYRKRTAYQEGFNKSFLNDGPYERIHMAVIGGSYKFPNLPFNLGMQYSFSYAENDGAQEVQAGEEEVDPMYAYTPKSGFAHAVSLSVKVYPEY